jgi:hypothetical protein
MALCFNHRSIVSSPISFRGRVVNDKVNGGQVGRVVSGMPADDGAPPA